MKDGMSTFSALRIEWIKEKIGGIRVKKRKIKRYRNARRNSGVKFAGILVIMITAVVCGYMTARFVIAPLLGYDTEVLKLDFPSKLTSILDRSKTKDFDGNEDFDISDGETSAKESGNDGEQEKPKETAETKDSGYALQFGVFAEKERAEKLSRLLKDDGIDVKIREKDGKYKVTGPLFETKQEAVTKLKSTSTDRVSGIFITMI